MACEVRKVTGRIIRIIYQNGNLNRAVLASLRNSTSIMSPRVQNVWPVMMANLDAGQLSRTGEPTRAEIAVYAGIRFYAIHQQGEEQFVFAPAVGPDAKGTQFFKALSKLRQGEGTRVALDRRVQPLLATTDVASVINELAHLIQIMKASSGGHQKIDYAQLAQDLYDLQANYEQANRVRLRWGQQYFWENRETDSEGEKK